jgi:hypothetical protein
VTSLVFQRVLFWLFVGFHFLLFFLKKFHKCDGDETSNCIPAKEIFAKYHPSWMFTTDCSAIRSWLIHEPPDICRYPLTIGDIKTISSLVTFFVVFYNGNCYGKFQGKKQTMCLKTPQNLIFHWVWFNSASSNLTSWAPRNVRECRCHPGSPP